MIECGMSSSVFISVLSMRTIGFYEHLSFNRGISISIDSSICYASTDILTSMFKSLKEGVAKSRMVRNLNLNGSARGINDDADRVIF